MSVAAAEKAHARAESGHARIDRHYSMVLCGLALAVGLLGAVSLLYGLPDAGTASMDGDRIHSDEVRNVVLRELRLPRTLLAIFVGATLGLAGAALQGLLRNPLADPGIIGTSSGASLGAVIALYFGLGSTVAWAVPVSGILGALVALALLWLLAGRDAGVMTLVLAGVAISGFAVALTSLALNLAPSPFAALEIAFWTLGSLTDRSMEHVWLTAPLVGAGWVLLFSCARALDALTLGEDVAASLGAYGRNAKLRLIGGSALAVGAAVSVTGTIGFIGLVVPHMLRPLVQYRPGRLLPVSALGGAVLLLAADLAVRLLATGPELKVGVLTSLVGAPFFLYLILRTRRASPW